jgi:hypothetical protein
MAIKGQEKEALSLQLRHEEKTAQQKKGPQENRGAAAPPLICHLPAG